MWIQSTVSGHLFILFRFSFEVPCYVFQGDPGPLGPPGSQGEDGERV